MSYPFRSLYLLVLSRFALDGRVCLGMTPPNYVESDWKDHKDTKLAESITAFKREAEAAASGAYDADSQVNVNISIKRLSPYIQYL